jgi:hypothetical protein
MIYRAALLTGLLFFATAWSVSAQEVTTGTMVDEMVDLDRLADMPAVPYKTLQFTSYDRRSNIPGGPDWFSNADGFGSEPIPAFEKVLKEPGEDGIGEYLVCDVEGPGCIVRTWTADINGQIKVYLDGAEEPLFDGPAEQFFHRPYEVFTKGTDFEGEALRGTFYQRDAAYCPMPFAKRCRIVWTGHLRQVHFYYVQIRQYQKDIAVKTFKSDDLKTYADNIKRTRKILADPDAHYPVEVAQTRPIEVKVPAGTRGVGLDLEGPGAIERLELSVEADDTVAALRQTVMHIACDGWTNPQVQSPVGDFFGAAPGINPYVSLPFTVEGKGKFTSRYVMPYQRSLRIEFENLGDQPVVIKGHVNAKPRKWNDDRTMHFYARWRVTHGITTYPPVDIPYLLANGTGRYVGSAAILLNPARGTHPSGSWWGEGDEKIFVDGDRFPSSFGTGSEDYFNYAWSAVDIFFHPYCGQPRNDGPANRGFVTNNRWHIIDDLPFQERISFYMELLSHHRVEGFSYACLGYHYGRPGKIDDHRVITGEDVRKPELPGPWSPLAYRGSQGATFYEPENVTDAKVEIEEGNLWTEGKLAVWKPKQEGDTLKLTIPVEKAGKYQVRIGVAYDNRGGSVSAKLNGKEFGFGGRAGKESLYNEYQTILQATESQVVELEAGDQEVVLTYEGPGKEGQEPFVGLDFIWLQPR